MSFALVFQYVMPVIAAVFSVLCAVVAGQNRDAIKSLDARIRTLEQTLMQGGSHV